MLHSLFRFCLVLPIALGLTQASLADEHNKAEFVIKIRGITAGIARLTGIEQDGLYAVRAEMESSGLAKVFRHFSYNGAVRGALDGADLRPTRYQDSADTGRRQSETVIDYARGIPEVTRYVSTAMHGSDSPDPSTQGGTLDPLSALYAVLRDAPRDSLCGKRIVMFDGRRRSAVTLGPPQDAGDGVICNGEYRRLQGFTQQEIARHRNSPLQVIYAPLDDGMMQVRRVAVQSVYGLATLDRR